MKNDTTKTYPTALLRRSKFCIAQQESIVQNYLDRKNGIDTPTPVLKRAFPTIAS